MSEVMTILIHFHQSYYRNFKAYYIDYVLECLRKESPGLVSYTRFLEFIPSVLLPLCVYLRTHCLGLCTSISYIDSTSLTVCKNPWIHHAHKVFPGLATHGKTSTGWFFGFKLHLLFNDRGELFNLMSLLLWRKRAISETIIDQLKNISQIAVRSTSSSTCFAD